jgi:uncharacterized protein
MSPEAASNRGLSRGCRLCQSGRWLCVFLTYRCDASCSFCPMPADRPEGPVSAFGPDPDSILAGVRDLGIGGIAFSGGEVFLDFDRMLDWLRYFRKRRPGSFFWAYTNGIRADEGGLTSLAAAGLNEIRFNLAATGYADSNVLEKVRLSVRLFSAVTVEVPSIPEDRLRLMEILPRLDAWGVGRLNLHERFWRTGEETRPAARAVRALLNFTEPVTIDAWSRPNTERIRRFCADRRLRIGVHSCDRDVKENQFLKRRLRMGLWSRRRHERLTADGLLETVVLTDPSLRPRTLRDRLMAGGSGLGEYLRSVHPSTAARRAADSGRAAWRVLFLPPMEAAGRRETVQIQSLTSPS